MDIAFYDRVIMYLDGAILVLLLIGWMCMDRMNIYWRQPKGE